jgi:hypothetical protein
LCSRTRRVFASIWCPWRSKYPRYKTTRSLRCRIGVDTVTWTPAPAMTSSSDDGRVVAARNSAMERA